MELFKRAEAGEFVLELTEVAAAEVVWVLTSFYKTSRADAANALLKLLGNPGVSAGNAPWLDEAFEDLREFNIDVADCFLAAHARRTSKPVVAFDNDFRKFVGLKWLNPAKV